MKRGKSMILMLCSLTVLLVIYFVMQHINEQSKAVSETEGIFELTSHTADDISGLSWSNAGITYSFVLDNGVWTTEEEPAWPVDQETVQKLAHDLMALRADRKLEDISSPADYGLETPVFSVTAAWQDGSHLTYNMGDATPFTDGYYISLSEDTSEIYTISSSLSSMFAKTKKDLLAMEEWPIVNDPVQFTVGNTLNAVKKSESTMVDPNQLWYDADTDEPLDGEQIDALISDLINLEWTDLVSAAASEEEMAQWYLDDDSAIEISLIGNDGSALNLLIGNSIEEDSWYARLAGSSMVYSLNDSSINSLRSASSGNLWLRSILPMPYEKVSKAEFTTEKGAFLLETNGQDLKAECSDEVCESPEIQEMEEIENSNTEGTENSLKDLWAQVTALKASERVEDAAGTDHILTIRASDTNGMEITVVFSEYDVESYLTTVNGQKNYLVPAADIDLLVRTIRSMQ